MQGSLSKFLSPIAATILSITPQSTTADDALNNLSPPKIIPPASTPSQAQPLTPTQFFNRYGCVIPGSYSFAQFLPIDTALACGYLKKAEAEDLRVRAEEGSFDDIYEIYRELAVALNVGQANAALRIESLAILSGYMSYKEFTETRKQLEKEDDHQYAARELFKIEILSRALISQRQSDFFDVNLELLRYPDLNSEIHHEDPKKRAVALLAQRAAKLAQSMSRLTGNEEILPKLHEILSNPNRDDLLDEVFDFTNELLSLKEITTTLCEAKRLGLLTTSEFFSILSGADENDPESRIKELIELVRLSKVSDAIISDLEATFPKMSETTQHLQALNKPQQLVQLTRILGELRHQYGIEFTKLKAEGVPLKIPMLPGDETYLEK